MTVVDRWLDWQRDVVIYRVNRCLYTEVANKDATSARSFRALAMGRVASLIGAAMPGHDHPAE